MKQLQKTAMTKLEDINKARENIFRENTKASAMVGFAGSVYNVEREGVEKRTEPDLGYLDGLVEYYKKYTKLSLSEPVESTSNENPDITMEEITEPKPKSNTEQKSDVEPKSDVEYTINQNDGTSPKGPVKTLRQIMEEGCS